MWKIQTECNVKIFEFRSTGFEDSSDFSTKSDESLNQNNRRRTSHRYRKMEKKIAESGKERVPDVGKLNELKNRKILVRWRLILNDKEIKSI